MSTNTETVTSGVRARPHLQLSESICGALRSNSQCMGQPGLTLCSGKDTGRIDHRWRAARILEEGGITDSTWFSPLSC